MFYAMTRMYNDIFGSVGVELFVFYLELGLYFLFRKTLISGFQKRLRRMLPAYMVGGLVFW